MLVDVQVLNGAIPPRGLIRERKKVPALWLGEQILKNVDDWKSAIFGAGAAPGALETLAKGGGLRPTPF